MPPGGHDLDPDLFDRPALLAQPALQQGQQLAQLGGGGAVVDQQAPLLLLHRPCMDLERRRDQGLHSAQHGKRLIHQIGQTRQRRRAVDGLRDRYGSGQASVQAHGNLDYVARAGSALADPVGPRGSQVRKMKGLAHLPAGRNEDQRRRRRVANTFEGFGV